MHKNGLCLMSLTVSVTPYIAEKEMDGQIAG